MKNTALALIKRIDGLMLLTVVIPTFIAIAYFGIFASDVYISESRFVVRSPDKPTSSGLGILLKSTGFTNAGEEAYAAENFVESRDALTAVNKDGLALKAYTSKDISIFDRFNPIGHKSNFEDLYKYYKKKVVVSHDTTSSVTTLTVRAFTPEDAQNLNRRLLEQSEALVNRLNVRGRRDLVQFAQAEVQEAKEATRAASIALANFRNKEGLSGAAFLVDSLPKQMQDFVLLLPMVHGVEYLREGYFGSQIRTHHDLVYMALINLGLTALALAQVRIISGKVVPQ